MQTKNSLNVKKIDILYVGIDISKRKFDITFYIDKKRKHFIFSNDENGFKELDHLLKKESNTKKIIIGMESTATYHINLADFSVSKKYDTYILNPLKVKRFSEALYQMKTDKNDSKAIVEFLELNEKSSDKKIYKYRKLSTAERKLKVLSGERARFIKLRQSEKNRLKIDIYVENKIRDKYIKGNIKFYDKKIEKIEKRIKNLIEENSILKKKYEVLTTIPGIGFVTAVGLISFMAELGKISNKKIASLGGLAPHPKDSGNKTGKAHIKKGRQKVKIILYMAALSAIRSKEFKPFYESLLARNKPKKVAIVAVMRKLLIIANSRMRDSLN